MSTANGRRDSEAPERDSLKPPHRRLVLMFDGTGNKRLNLSNVARMFEAIDDSKPGEYEPYTEVCSDVSSQEPVPGCVEEPDSQPRQLLRYIKGVGTDVLGHFSGLGFGYGLAATVITGYVWLCNNYREGDEIFVFGFSRGAYSARSLVSLAHRCGGVVKKQESISGKNDQGLKENSAIAVKAYDMYMCYVQTTTADGKEKHDPVCQQDFCKAWQDFTATVTKDNFRIQHVTIKMLGVWDTVGSVGIPETRMKVLDNHVYPFSRYSSKWYQMHGHGLPCIVENAYHALAIDEQRKHFSPTLWDKVTSEDQEVKQVWFVGSHSNVGGGADLDDVKDPDDLWQYSYVWMQKHAIKHGLRFYWTYDTPPTQRSSSEGPPLRTRRVSLRKPEDSYTRFLGGVYKWVFKRFIREADETNGAKLHWSVTDRMALSVKQGEDHSYFPKALFGRDAVDGTQFTKVEPDVVEIRKQDGNTTRLVRWQIEPHDAEATSEPLHRLPVTECTCRHPIVAPVRPTGFWSWFGS